MVTYADRPWTAHYDEFVPESLKPYPEKTIHDYLDEAADATPDATAIITTLKLPLLGRQDDSLTYAALKSQADALAAGLVAMGLQPNDRVALVMPNCAAFAISYYAVLKAGGVVAATNPTYPAERLAYQINDCDAEIVICLSMFYETVKQVQPQTKVKNVIVSNIKEYFPRLARMVFTVAAEKKGGHRLEDGLQPGDVWFQDVLDRHAGQVPDVQVSPDDLALFQYTGGTTGISKGAMGTHQAIVCNLVMLDYWSGFRAGLYDEYGQLVYLGAIPMFHVYGLVVLLSQAIAHSAAVVMIPNARDIDEVVDVIDHYKPNSFLGVPALYNAINNHPRVQSGDVSLESLILNTSGSAPLPSATKEEYDARVPGDIVEGYGLSESFVAVTGNPLRGKQKIRSIGVPYPDVDIKIVSLDDPSQTVPVGEDGELVLHSPTLMRGYHRMATETSNALRKDDNGKTWLYTGDVARMDEDGYFYIVDRKKDMALIGGYNVYPSQVEEVLKRHPDILEVGVAAIPHPQRDGEEALKAWVVPKKGKKLTEEALISHCETGLAPYEIPRRYSFIDEIPKTEVGKTLRRELVRMEMEDRENQPQLS